MQPQDYVNKLNKIKGLLLELESTRREDSMALPLGFNSAITDALQTPLKALQLDLVKLEALIPPPPSNPLQSALFEAPARWDAPSPRTTSTSSGTHQLAGLAWGF